VAAGVAGGVAAATVLYGIYLVTPAGKMTRTINKGAREASKKYDEAVKKLQANTPEPSQAIDYLKEFSYSYVSWIPGGRQYVDTVFKDIETLRQDHGDEVNKIVNETYKQFQDLSKSGLSMDTATKAYDVLTEFSKKIAGLAGNAFTDLLDNHPQVKDKFGGSIDQLKQMAEQYGPEVKEQIDETWKKAGEIVAGGFTVANIDKARKLVEESVQKVKKLGDEAWKKGLEQAKPYLDKNPKVRELIEKNADALKQGNVKELFEKAKSAVDSSNLGELEEYVNKAVDQAKSKGSQLTGGFGLGGLEQYFDKIPSGSEILSKVQQLREVAEQHSGEAEKLLKETMEEVKKVLEEKSEKAQKIAESAKKESK
jgi:F0F1-type ATP synthase membrane subunit b/b'